MICAGVGGYFIGGHHKEVTLEDKFHAFLDAAIVKVSAAGSSVKATVVDYSTKAKNGAAAGAASALHATEEEAAYLLRAAAEKIKP